MPQFFIKSEDINNDIVFITSHTDIRHIINVLRYNAGDKLTLIADNIIYEVKISLIKSDLIEAQIIDKYESQRKLNINITLAQSILKSPRQDITIQKATELGVRKIIPFFSQNTVIKINSDEDKIKKIQRWQKISNEAAKQCERADLAEISHIISLSELIKLNEFDVKFVCVERKAKVLLKTFLSQQENIREKNAKILIIIGPEGGWSDHELDLFETNNIMSLSLGNLILRAETAAITAISDVIYEYEL